MSRWLGAEQPPGRTQDCGVEPGFGLRSGFEGLGPQMWEGLEIDWGDQAQGPMGGHDLGKGPGMVDRRGG